MGQLQRKKGVPAAPVAGAGTWVAVGGGSVIATSPNGKDWTSVISQGGSSGEIYYGYSVAYNGTNRWVAVGSSSGSKLATSTDSITWTQIAFNAYGGLTGNVFDVAYANGRWVAVGAGSIIASSTNGTSWTASTTKGGITQGSAVAYGNGLWIVVGSGSAIATSTNGTAWTEVPVGQRGSIGSGTAVAYGRNGTGAGLWVVASNTFVTSPDGTNWTDIIYDPVDFTTGGLISTYDIAYGIDASGIGLWVAVGEGSAIATSTDGSNWTAVTAQGGSLYGFNLGSGVKYGNGLWVVVGGANNTPMILTSPNGINWTVATSTGGIGTAVVSEVAFKP
jgi:hypothetical protein